MMYVRVRLPPMMFRFANLRILFIVVCPILQGILFALLHSHSSQYTNRKKWQKRPIEKSMELDFLGIIVNDIQQTLDKPLCPIKCRFMLRLNGIYSMKHVPRELKRPVHIHPRLSYPTTLWINIMPGGNPLPLQHAPFARMASCIPWAIIVNDLLD
jgi:hypothetical protein